jgi:hypothetical protein
MQKAGLDSAIRHNADDMKNCHKFTRMFPTKPKKENPRTIQCTHLTLKHECCLNPPGAKQKRDLQSVDTQRRLFYDGAIFPTNTRENARSLRFLHESPTNAMMCFQLLEQT